MDLDQSASIKNLQRLYLGPSLGWIDAVGYTMTVPTAGTTIIPLGMTLVRVSTANLVTVVLPLARGNIATPGALAGLPITVIDVTGQASTNPITIQATSPDTIDGLASAQITSNFGFFNFKPNVVSGGYNLQ